MDQATKTRWSAFAIGISMPLLAVAGVTVISMLSPVDATLLDAVIAETTLDMDETKDKKNVVVEINDAMRIADVHVAQLKRDQSNALNPFYYYIVPDNSGELQIEPLLDDDLDILEVELSGVIGGAYPAALIDGQLYKIGDTIEEGWTLTSIDVDARIAVITGPDGTILTVEPSDGE